MRGPDRRGDRGAPAGRAGQPVLRRRPVLTASCICCPRWSTVGPTRRRPARRRVAARPARRRGRPGAGSSRRGGSRWSSTWPDDELLPAIYFIFSRAACDDAVERVRRRRAPPDDGGRAGPHPRDRRASTSSALSDGDLDVLGYDRWLAGLEPGIAAHHAGMVPPFKEAVEACFVRRSRQGRVRHRDAGARHQHAGSHGGDREADEVHRRAPRVPHPGRVHPADGGPAGGASTPSATPIVLWSPFVPFEQVAALASSRAFGLTSAFRPTYNMAANLVAPVRARRGAPPAEPVVRPVPGRPRGGAARGAARAARRRRWPPLEAEARCDRGDVEEYRSLLDAADEARRRLRPSRQERRSTPSRQLRPGDVIAVDTGRSTARAAVLTVAHRGDDIRLQVIDRTAQGPHPRRGRLRRTARGARPHRPADALRAEQPRVPAPGGRARCSSARVRGRRAPGSSPRDRPSTRRRPPRAERHPVAACPDRDRHLRATPDSGECGPRSTSSSGRSRAAPSRWPAGSTGCCGCSRPGATSTAGR